MTVSAAWIRNNILFSGDKHERQLTGVELKIQRPFQKISISDWYVNKRSNSPRTLNDIAIETRSALWKDSSSQKDSTLNLISSDLLDILIDQKTNKEASTITRNNETYHRQKSAESKLKKCAVKPSPDRNKLNFEKKLLNFLSPGKRSNSETQSPYKKFLGSKKKSTELENVVKSKQPQREKSVIRGIIEVLTEKVSKSSLPRQNQNIGINQNFVKQLVKIFEKTNAIEVENPLSERNSVDVKPCITSVSPEIIDNNNNCSLRNEDQKCQNYDRLVTKKVLNIEQKILENDNSVYWIPVSKCKLERSSSLLSMSRSSTNSQSPSVSPINSENEVENPQATTWETTLKKTSAVSRKLFRIDETITTDSGYSDKSEASSILSEPIRLRRSSRRMSII